MRQRSLRPEPSPMVHFCQARKKYQWEQYCTEWPPKVVVCPNCAAPLKLAGYNTGTGTTTYRRI